MPRNSAVRFNIVTRLLIRTIERKIKDIFGEDQFGYVRAKGSRDINGMLGIISERTLDTDEGLVMSFIDGQKEFGFVNRTKFADPKGSWNRWARKKLISKLYMNKNVNQNWSRGKEV
jgi:hypothetical protein